MVTSDKNVGVFRKAFIQLAYKRLSLSLFLPRAIVSGTATVSINESDVVTGGKTVVITLTGDTWVTG